MKQQGLVLIDLDEARRDQLSCDGYQRVHTPSIDRIATIVERGA